MREALSYLGGLAQLHQLAGEDEARALWRQGMATLAALAVDQHPVPLEGLDPDALQASVRLAIDRGMVDDLGWLSAPAAAVAVFELASALPPSHEKRELGRRVLTTLRRSDAATFVALATSLALGSRRGLTGEHVRARVALALYLPSGAGTRPDALALALISRRDLEREWLVTPSAGSLPSRRLAARLIERAAREAARRGADGDDTGLRVFEKKSVRAAWGRLLADRESLVWRHVAAARGILSAVVDRFAHEIESGLSPDLSPTEWRRAAASLAASVAVDPSRALGRSRDVLRSVICERDRGVSSCMIFGLGFAADVERDAAEDLLGSIVRAGGIAAIEALADLRRARPDSDVGDRAAIAARAHLRDEDDTDDDGLAALLESLQEELLPADKRSHPTLRDRLGTALRAFGDGDSLEATRALLDAADASLTLLESAGSSEDANRSTFRALQEIDTALLETSAVGDLLVASRDPEAKSHEHRLEELFGRLTDWLLAAEAQPLSAGARIDHPTLRMRRLRTLLHLVDADRSYTDDRSGALRQRRLATTRVLLDRVRMDPESMLRRTLCAGLARSCDALLREEVCELSDVLVAISLSAQRGRDLEVIGEASMVAELETALAAYSGVLHSAERADDHDAATRCQRAVTELAHALAPASSGRVEALRVGLLQLARGLAQLATATSLASLGGTVDSGALGRLALGAERIAQLVAGAKRRLGLEHSGEPPASGAALRAVAAMAERARNGTRDGLDGAIADAASMLELELPPALARATALTLERLRQLPLDAPAHEAGDAAASEPSADPPLAPWLPANRTLGGFHVRKAIGSGAVGSVFVARRVDQRHDDSAESFALKVPEYDGAAAHTLSEAEFLRLFREEAGALLALPESPNLARFVTFDAGARPKPILVMELVVGPTLEDVLDEERLDVTEALALLDGIGAGLAAMHSVGVGHLDVKPGNIILRDPPDTSDSLVATAARPDAVLVDFGLAGRQIRPGCGTVYYGAPEVWKRGLAGATPSPTAVDVYAYCCLAYEMLTGVPLFDGPTPIAVVTAHLSHDGGPEQLHRWAETIPAVAPLAELLGSGLRRDPNHRPTMRELRDHLRALAPELTRLNWPLPL